MAADRSDDDGGPAFPGIEPPGGGYEGMSLRDYFAGQALASQTGGPPDLVARSCYRYADALIKLKKEWEKERT